MFKRALTTTNQSVKLIAPEVTRDAQLGVKWMAGTSGRQTLKMMGITDADNKPTTLKAETERVKGFLEKSDQYNWMIESDGQVIGTVWVDLQPSNHIPAPAISIMIGEHTMRGAGIGQASLAAVMTFLQEAGHSEIFSRHLVENKASAAMLTRLGFAELGDAYVGDEGRTWQNVVSTYAA